MARMDRITIRALYGSGSSTSLPTKRFPHMPKVLDSLKTVVLVLAAFGGIVVSTFDLIGHPISWIKDVPSITLILLGLLALDLSLERFTAFRRIERKLESMEWAKEAHDLPGRQRELINDSIADFVRLQTLKTRSEMSNRPFGLIVDDLIDEQVALLRGLAVGRLNLPTNHIASAHGKMAMHYRKRLDAVSETDLDFWTDKHPLAEEYFWMNARAVRSGTAVTRIFILSLPDLKGRAHEVAAVLERQHKAGIGWGVAVVEELEYDVRHADVPMDFAIYDTDKAVSFFRRNEARRFEAIFSTYREHSNAIRISDQREVHRKLITECWLANDIFKNKYPAALTEEELSEVSKKTSGYNSRLSKQLGPGVVEDDTFVLLASQPEEIETKVRRLAEVVESWRSAQGYHAGSS